MTRIFLATLCLAVAAVAAVHWKHPDELARYAGSVLAAVQWVWAGIEANPVPAALAGGTFLLTVLYHKAKGKSLREYWKAPAVTGRTTTSVGIRAALAAASARRPRRQKC